MAFIMISSKRPGRKSRMNIQRNLKVMTYSTGNLILMGIMKSLGK